MSKLSMYLIRNTDYCAETRNLIEDVINSIAQQNDFLSTDAKKAILRDALQGMGFSDEQLTAFAKCEIPTEYQMVPINAHVVREYRVWMRMPVGILDKDARELAEEYLLNTSLMDIDISDDESVEDSDIQSVEIDWDGAHYE